MKETIETTHDFVASKLMFPLWKCIKADFKAKHRASTWEMFENFVKSAASAPDLPKFFDKVKRLMPYEPEKKFEESILLVLQYGDSNKILSMLRSECAYVVLLTRAINNEYNEQFQSKKTTTAK